MSILSYFKLSTPATVATADDEPQPLTSRQADTEEGTNVSDLLALMDLDNDEMLIDDTLPLPPILYTPLPLTTPTSNTPA